MHCKILCSFSGSCASAVHLSLVQYNYLVVNKSLSLAFLYQPFSNSLWPFGPVACVPVLARAECDLLLWDSYLLVVTHTHKTRNGGHV